MECQQWHKKIQREKERDQPRPKKTFSRGVYLSPLKVPKTTLSPGIAIIEKKEKKQITKK
jgi:hypothetical protein